ncbi:MAG: helix-turn-helix transcriptional regulator [Actinomycetota bacterium]
MDRAELADFLRRRREALQPEDVGLNRGPRRRTDGLRREEVAALCDMSVDYYSRLEQARGPQPSEQMLASIARGLRLTLDERDHLFRLGGHGVPVRALRGDHISPGLMRVLDRLQDTPAQVMSELGETLVQTPAARALFGDETRFDGMSRSVTYRWFTDPATRAVYPVEDHPVRSRGFTADLRRVYTKHGAESRAGAVVDVLLERSAEFAELWAAHEVNSIYSYEKRLLNAEVGELTVQCQLLHDPEQGQALLVFTATPGTESYQKLQLLSVIGNQQISAAVDR